MSLHKLRMVHITAGGFLVFLSAQDLLSQDPRYMDGWPQPDADVSQSTKQPVPEIQKLKTTVILKATDITVKAAVSAIAKQAGLKIIFDSETPLNQTLPSVDLLDVPALTALQMVLRGTGVTVLAAKDGNTILLKRSKSDRDSLEKDRTTHRSITGRVVDASTKQPVAGAMVVIAAINQTSITDKDGKFTFNVMAGGNYTVVVRLLGYSSVSREVNLVRKSMETLEISLNPMPQRLQE